ncbi:hypothetical protein [Afifella sp. IM 167]|uniref:hypothetical protein n=1 Tax=Afifella sp. IM 167 TaxID=2033586 RepID=UPI001CCFD62A|nr:hypothetical protein [Afifella sp. IM 167]MBZ8133208.1 hypothetical protein [Afifella sp. IM 167]
MTGALAVVGRILAFGITVPVWVFLAAGLWLHFDKSSAVRQAVDRAVTELVAGAELAAARAEAAAQEKLRVAAEARAAEVSAANARFQERLAEAAREQENLSDEIQELLARPVSADCTVDDDLLGRMPNR